MPNLPHLIQIAEDGNRGGFAKFSDTFTPTFVLTLLQRMGRLEKACQAIADGEYDCDCVHNQDPRDGYVKVFKCPVCQCRAALAEG